MYSLCIISPSIIQVPVFFSVELQDVLYTYDLVEQREEYPKGINYAKETAL